jgi:hypothetical protein
VTTRGGRWTIVGILFAISIALGWAIVPGLIHRPIAAVGATAIHDAATLPDHISVCGRSWSKDVLGREFSRAQVNAQFGGEPTLVEPLPGPPCPPGPCTQVAQDGPCDTVVFVRVGEDAYVDYSLQGGP